MTNLTTSFVKFLNGFPVTKEEEEILRANINMDEFKWERPTLNDIPDKEPSKEELMVKLTNGITLNNKDKNKLKYLEIHPSFKNITPQWVIFPHEKFKKIALDNNRTIDDFFSYHHKIKKI
jgi:hypothetical protein